MYRISPTNGGMCASLHHLPASPSLLSTIPHIITNRVSYQPQVCTQPLHQPYRNRNLPPHQGPSYVSPKKDQDLPAVRSTNTPPTHHPARHFQDPTRRRIKTQGTEGHQVTADTPLMEEQAPWQKTTYPAYSALHLLVSQGQTHPMLLLLYQ